MRCRITACLFAILTSTTLSSARMDVTLDADTLNTLISGMAQDRIEVRLGANRSIPIFLEGFRVAGFNPAGGADGQGSLKTQVTVKIPNLGIETPVEPQLAFRCKDRDGRKVCALFFEEFAITLPITGTIDLAALFPPMELLPESAWLVPTAKGKVRVKPTLVDTKMGQKNLRLGFDLDVLPPDRPAAPSQVPPPAPSKP